jgi:hypothetical protein
MARLTGAKISAPLQTTNRNCEFIYYDNLTNTHPTYEHNQFLHVSSMELFFKITVVLATRYGLDGPRIESRWRARFSAPVQTGPGAHPASYTIGTGYFLGVNRLGRGVDHPPPTSAGVKERVELYLYSPSWPSWPVLG